MRDYFWFFILISYVWFSAAVLSYDWNWIVSLVDIIVSLVWLFIAYTTHMETKKAGLI